MRTVLALISLMIIPFFLGYSQNQNISSVDDIYEEQSLIIGIAHFGKSFTEIELSLTLKNSLIDQVHFVEKTDDNPLEAHIFVSNLISDGYQTRVFFDHHIVDRLINITFDSYFSKEGGIIYITILQNEEPVEKKIIIKRNEDRIFDVYYFEKYVQKELRTLDIEINFIKLFKFNIKNYILSDSIPKIRKAH